MTVMNEVKADNEVKESVKMLKGKELIVNVIAKMQNEIKENKAMVYEMTVEEMLEGGELDTRDLVIENEEDLDYIEESDIPGFVRNYIKELNPNELTEISFYHIEENRPTILRYSSGGLRYKSPYHREECFVSGSAFVYEIDKYNQLYILKMEENGKTYYELYLTRDDILCPEEEDETEYVLLRNTDALCSSTDSDMEESLQALYNAAEKCCQYSKLSHSAVQVLNELLAE